MHSNCWPFWIINDHATNRSASSNDGCPNQHGFVHLFRKLSNNTGLLQIQKMASHYLQNEPHIMPYSLSCIGIILHDKPFLYPSIWVKSGYHKRFLFPLCFRPFYSLSLNIHKSQRFGRNKRFTVLLLYEPWRISWGYPFERRYGCRKGKYIRKR